MGELIPVVRSLCKCLDISSNTDKLSLISVTISFTGAFEFRQLVTVMYPLFAIAVHSLCNNRSLGILLRTYGHLNIVSVMLQQTLVVSILNE